MNGQMITNIHEDIVKVLVSRLEKKNRNPMISYTELCNEIGNQVNCRNIGSYLGDISSWCNDIGAPMISVLVMNQSENRPGSGFYKLYADIYGTPLKSIDEEFIFVSELKKVLAYHNWKELMFYLGI